MEVGIQISSTVPVLSVVCRADCVSDARRILHRKSRILRTLNRISFRKASTYTQRETESHAIVWSKVTLAKLQTTLHDCMHAFDDDSCERLSIIGSRNTTPSMKRAMICHDDRRLDAFILFRHQNRCSDGKQKFSVFIFALTSATGLC